jgi:hypothetical protein
MTPSYGKSPTATGTMAKLRTAAFNLLGLVNLQSIRAGILVDLLNG